MTKRHDYEFGRHLDAECRLCNPPSPMTDMVSVPAEKIAALREALDALNPDDFGGQSWVDFIDAARAVVDAVETEAAPDELTALRERIRALADEWVGRVDEAYDYGMQLKTLLGGTNE